MELEGKELDAAVALALGWEHPGAVGKTEPTADGAPWCRSGCNDWWRHPVGGWLCSGCYGFPYQYSSDWAIGGPLIDEHRISLKERGSYWFADMRAAEGERGHSALTAAMRALVRSKPPNVEVQPGTTVRRGDSAGPHGRRPRRQRHATVHALA